MYRPRRSLVAAGFDHVPPDVAGGTSMTARPVRRRRSSFACGVLAAGTTTVAGTPSRRAIQATPMPLLPELQV